MATATAAACSISCATRPVFTDNRKLDHANLFIGGLDLLGSAVMHRSILWPGRLITMPNLRSTESVKAVVRMSAEYLFWNHLSGVRRDLVPRGEA